MRPLPTYHSGGGVFCVMYYVILLTCRIISTSVTFERGNTIGTVRGKMFLREYVTMIVNIIYMLINAFFVKIVNIEVKVLRRVHCKEYNSHFYDEHLG